jgi:hypothetical protein
MLAMRCTRPYNYLVRLLDEPTRLNLTRGSVSLAVPVAITASASAPTASAALPSPATPAAASLFRPITAFAVNRTVPARFEGHRRSLSTTGTDHGRARAHAGAGPAAGAVTAFMLGMGRGVATPATPTPAAALLSLSARFAAPGRGVAAFLEKLLLTSSENKFLTAVATGK